jgi:hypothetical protein
MKRFGRILFFLALVNIGSHPLYSQWTAKMHFQDIYFRSQSEFRITLWVDVLENGIKQQPDSGWYYDWRYNDETGWHQQTAGYDLWTIGPDGNINTIHLYTVNIVGSGFNIWSDTLEAGMYGTPQIVAFPAKRSDGTGMNNQLVHVSHYTDPSWTTNTDGQGPVEFILRQNGDDVMRSKPDFVNQIAEGFHRWLPNIGDVSYLNHDVFGIAVSLTSVTAHYSSKSSATVRSYLDGHQLGDSIQFRDPWLVDTTDARFYDSAYNAYRNLGLPAVFKMEPSPLYLNSSTKYNGVFLNENPTWDETKPNYSVGASSPQDISGFDSYFLRWSGSHATFQDSFALETPVVFTSGGAIATARYKAHRASSVSNPTGSNSQRVLGYHEGYHKYFLTYTSAGDVFFTESDDGGDNWSPEVLVSSGAGVSDAPSLVVNAGLGPRKTGGNCAVGTDYL